MLELGLYEMVGRAKDQEFKCLVCEEKVETKSKIQRHVFSHFLEASAVDYAMAGRGEEDTEEEDPYEDLRWVCWGRLNRLKSQFIGKFSDLGVR